MDNFNKSAVDWLFTYARSNLTLMSEHTEEEAKNIVNAMCPLDRQLDSPCPRWVLNILRCVFLGYKDRCRLIIRHHQDITGQEIYSPITYEPKAKIANAGKINK